jgi:phosphate uptake regulator
LFENPLRVLVDDLGNKLKEGMAAYFERDHALAVRIWMGDDAVDAVRSDASASIRTIFICS